MPKKSPEQKAEEEHRYILASGAANTAELEPFLTDQNQAIRVTAAMNPDADAEILDCFANDKFWGVWKSSTMPTSAKPHYADYSKPK